MRLGIFASYRVKQIFHPLTIPAKTMLLPTPHKSEGCPWPPLSSILKLTKHPPSPPTHFANYSCLHQVIRYQSPAKTSSRRPYHRRFPEKLTDAQKQHDAWKTGELAKTPEANINAVEYQRFHPAACRSNRRIAKPRMIFRTFLSEPSNDEEQETDAMPRSLALP